MRYLVATLLLATPALGHSTDLPHSHSVDWLWPLLLVVIPLTALVPLRRLIRAKIRK